MNIIEIFTKSLSLIFSFDRELWEIILLSLYVSLVALIFASIFGLLISYHLALRNFFFKNKRLQRKAGKAPKKLTNNPK